MSANVLTIEAAKQASIPVIEDDKGAAAVHEVIVALRANRRSGTAHAKSRSEVVGSSAKPWRQKGTGRARAGTRKSPIWVGGGVAHGPKQRDYSKQINRQVRRLAFRRALSERIKDGDVLTIDSFEVPDGRTQSFITALRAVTESPRVLIIGGRFEDKTFLAARNVQDSLLISAHEVNVEQLLYFDRLVVTREALDVLAQRTA
jgi:large subunit ribosomal protein L4